jgi:hypothetical protein
MHMHSNTLRSSWTRTTVSSDATVTKALERTEVEMQDLKTCPMTDVTLKDA